MWHNLLHSKILYDLNGHYASLQKTYQIPLSTGTQKHIIERQLLLLEQAMPAFSHQIEKSYQTPRSSQYESSYMSEFLLPTLTCYLRSMSKPIPGEKRMLEYAKTHCTLLPKQFEETISKYFQLLYQPQQGEQAVVTLQTILKGTKSHFAIDPKRKCEPLLLFTFYLSLTVKF